MFNKIVIGVDGSELGRDALALGRALSRITGADLLLAHVYPRDPLGGRIVAIRNRPLRDAVEELLAREASYAPPGTRTVAVADVSVAHALHRIAEAERADLLVVGSNRHGVLGRILLGDIARQTIHGAPCAVAVAPRGYATTPNRIHRIGVGYDGSGQAQHALDAAAELAAAGGAELALLHVISPPFQGVAEYAYAYPVDWTDYFDRAEVEARRDADRAIQALDVPATAEVRESRPVEALLALSDECDLLFVGSRHWGTLRRVVPGSTADGVASRARCPVIVVPMGAPRTEQAAVARVA